MDKYNQKWVLYFAQDKSKTNAVTIGQTTYYSESEEFVKKDIKWQTHEDTHKKQWKEQGKIKFSLKYLWYSIRYGYQNNPFEVAAREAENIEGK